MSIYPQLPNPLSRGPNAIARPADFRGRVRFFRFHFLSLFPSFLFLFFCRHARGGCDLFSDGRTLPLCPGDQGQSTESSGKACARQSGGACPDRRLKLTWHGQALVASSGRSVGDLPARQGVEHMSFRAASFAAQPHRKMFSFR